MAEHEGELVGRLRAGDPAALQEILSAYWRPLLLYAARSTPDMDAAEDVVQEVIVRLWGCRASLRPGSLGALLYRMTRNLLLDEARRRGTRSRWLESEAIRPFNAPLRTPAVEMEERELHAVVSQAIEALAPRRREVFTLAYFHRMSYGEIADLLGIAPATVKNQMAAALVELRGRLRPHFPPGPDSAAARD